MRRPGELTFEPDAPLGSFCGPDGTDFHPLPSNENERACVWEVVRGMSSDEEKAAMLGAWVLISLPSNEQEAFGELNLAPGAVAYIAARLAEANDDLALAILAKCVHRRLLAKTLHEVGREYDIPEAAHLAHRVLRPLFFLRPRTAGVPAVQGRQVARSPRTRRVVRRCGASRDGPRLADDPDLPPACASRRFRVDRGQA